MSKRKAYIPHPWAGVVVQKKGVVRHFRSEARKRKFFAKQIKLQDAVVGVSVTRVQIVHKPGRGYARRETLKRI